MQKIFPLRITRKHVRMIVWPLLILLFTTVGIPLLFFFYWFNAAKIKQIVINQFNNQNYAVVINGGVEPRSWHGLSLFIADLTVEDKTQHIILHINTANCQLSWPDLIIGHYKIKRIALNGVTFYQAGINQVNYANLLDYEKISKSEFNNLNYLSVTNLNLVESEDRYIIRDANLNISELASNARMHLNFKVAPLYADVNISGKVDRVENNQIIIDKLNTTIISPKLNAEFQSQGHYNYLNQELWIEHTQGLLNSKFYNGTMNIGTMLISGYGLTVNDLIANLSNSLSEYNQAYNINIHRIETDDFNKYMANNVLVRYEADNAKNKINLNLELNDTILDKALNITNNSCNIGAKLRIKDNPDSPATNLVAGMRGKCSYFESTETTSLNLSGNVDASPAQIIMDYTNGQLKPRIKLTGSITNLNLSKFVTDPTKDNLLPLYSDNSKLPFKWLNWFDLDVLLSVKQLDLSRIALTNIKTAFQVRNNQLKLSQFIANAYGGSINGTALVSKVNDLYNIQIQQQIANMSLQRLFSNLFNVNAIQGKANLLINTTTNGVATYEDLHRKLNGQISLRVSDGGFSGVDFSLFLSPENLAAFQNRRAMMTNFTQLKADFNFVNGVSNKSNITFNSPTIAANGGGIINFAETKIDYSLKVSSILPLNTQKIKSVSIPVQIKGDLFNPKIYIQNMTLNSEYAKPARLHNQKNKLGNKSNKKQRQVGSQIEVNADSPLKKESRMVKNQKGNNKKSKSVLKKESKTQKSKTQDNDKKTIESKKHKISKELKNDRKTKVIVKNNKTRVILANKTTQGAGTN